MLDTVLGKIAGFFEKDFLFASFLPALIFIPCLLAALAAAVGVEAVWAWVDSWTATQKAAAAVAGTLGVIVFAYVLQALRTSFTQVWTGNSRSLLLWGFKQLGVFIQKRRYRTLRGRAWRLSPWQKVLDAFGQEVRSVWSNTPGAPPAGRAPLPADKRQALEQRVQAIRVGMAEGEVRDQLREFTLAYGIYSGDDLKDIYKAIKDKLGEWHASEDVRTQTDSYNLDRRFGTLETIKATGLGNVIEAFNQYPFKRYKIEPEIFWPRLRKVMTPEYLELVQESRILLDFSLTMASLAVVYAFLVLTVGPWLWFSLWVWVPLALAAVSVSYFFYRLSFSAAYQLGEMVRSSFDLFRLELMSSLARPRPTTFTAERAQWEELSKLAVYGTNSDFALSPEKAATPTP